MQHCEAAVWLSNTGDASYAPSADWLGPSEWARLATFVRPERRRQFIAGRALLRAALAPLLNLAPADIRLVERPGNAPLLDCPHSALPFFSVSHSGPWIACAVSATTPVGLDIERLDASRDLAALAAQAFDATQQARLAVLDPAARLHAFYEMWSTAEAQFKLGMPAAQTTVLAHAALAIVLCSSAPLLISLRLATQRR